MSHNYSKTQMDTNNQVSAQQLAMQQQQLAQYNNYLQQITAGGGYLPGVKSALTSQATQNIPQQYQQIARAMQTQAGARGLAGGGNLPGGGQYLNNYGQLLSQEELAKSNALNSITAQGQQNIMGAQQGNLQAAGITSGVGSSALGSATNAANSATQNQGGIMGSLLGAGAGILGGALGAGGILNKG